MAFIPWEPGTVQAVAALLSTNDEFQAAYPDARLVWVELNWGVPENHQRRYYLRSHSDTGATEFWGSVSAKPKSDFRRDMMEIVAMPDTLAKPYFVTVSDCYGWKASPLNMATKSQWVTAQNCAKHQKWPIANQQLTTACSKGWDGKLRSMVPVTMEIAYEKASLQKRK